MPSVQIVINTPRNVNFLPANCPIEPITPALNRLPMANSASNSGIDQIKRKRIHKRMNEPPYWPANRGNLQRLPAPIAMPREAKIIPHRLLNCSTLDIRR